MSSEIVNGIEFTRVNNDVNGNPRVVVHYTNFSKPEDSESPILERFGIALNRARTIGGSKYRGKDYGGGIVFQCYSKEGLANAIYNLMDGGNRKPDAF